MRHAYITFLDVGALKTYAVDKWRSSNEKCPQHDGNRHDDWSSQAM